MIISYQGIEPKIHSSVFVAPGAMIIGDVTIEAESSVWFNAVLRGDLEPIRIGCRTNIQDGTVIHMDKDMPCLIGNDVTVGHGAILHSCAIDNEALIGMGAILLTGARIGERAIIAAGTLVLEGQEIPAGTVAMGVPAKVRREITEEERIRVQRGKNDYVLHGKIMRESLKM
ncbi:gamma carbonic anhydrase family protein [Candidatus Poribacteria bacterium]|nr:gamma carbonic anhydrase family protein [Candidatus Poribacteria bacterium]MYF56125.1 gamma carbonic anhydrase family protein [Candidatus Poribacteria bacterium]MYI93647.1 gamma carbonic anhydrase family protein [Candidatus Poribacteria bacterium]